MSWVHAWACYQAWGQGWPVEKPELDSCDSYLLGGRQGAERPSLADRWLREWSGGWASLRQRAPEKSQVTWVREPGRKRVHLWLPDVRPPEQGAWPSLLCGPLDPRVNPGDLKQENDPPLVENELRRRQKENQRDELGGWSHHLEVRWGNLHFSRGDGPRTRVPQRNRTDGIYICARLYLCLYHLYLYL